MKTSQKNLIFAYFKVVIDRDMENNLKQFRELCYVTMDTYRQSFNPEILSFPMHQGIISINRNSYVCIWDTRIRFIYIFITLPGYKRATCVCRDRRMTSSIDREDTSSTGYQSINQQGPFSRFHPCVWELLKQYRQGCNQFYINRGEKLAK